MINNKSGNSLLEAVLALGIFALMITSVTVMITGGFGLSRLSELSSQADALAQEGIELARAVHSDSWNTIPYTQEVNETIGRFLRTTTYSAVCRSATHDIALCPASYTDIHTKEVLVVISWQDRPGITNTLHRSTYLTNWESRDWKQTDWSGGGGQAIWNDATQYDSASSIVATTTPGQIRLADASDGQWYISGGSEHIDTSDTDFTAGSFSDTAISGSGEGAGITLEQGLRWADHQDSASSTSSHLNAVSAVSPSDIWVSANNGEILHYDGSAWSRHSDIGSTHLRGMAVRSSSDGWAAGQSGKIYHYDGATWTQHKDTGNHSWFDIAAVASNDVWVVGSNNTDDDDDDEGKIAHYNGSTWSYTTPPSDNVIYGVSAVSATDIWAAGKSGRIWHYNGSAWIMNTDTGSETWNDIVFLSATDGWVAGKSGKVAHWNGSSWSISTVPSAADIKSIAAVSSSDIWAVGQSGKIWRWNGSAWAYYGTEGSDTLNNAVMIDAQNGWAVGNNGRIIVYGLSYDTSGTFQSAIIDTGTPSPVWSVASWVETLTIGGDVTVATRSGATASPDGSWSSWSAELTTPNGSTITSPSARYLQYRITFTNGENPSVSPRLDAITIQYNLATSEHLYVISALSSSNVWAAGSAGTIIHFDGTSWTKHTDTGNETWSAMDFISSSDGWVAGSNGSVAHWNGSSWSESSVPSAADITSLAMVASDNVWAVGLSGRIWHYDGSVWRLDTDTGSQTWKAVTFSGANDGWAAGSSGALAHWDGAAWTPSTIPSSDTIASIYSLTSSDIWASGASGKIWHYDGTLWSLHTDTGSEQWNAAYFAISIDGWVVGLNGSIRGYRNSEWIAFSAPSAQNLHGASFANRKIGWAVGDRGTVLRFYREAVTVLSGTILSSAYSLGDNSPIQTIEWNDVSADCYSPCALRFQLRAAPDAAGAPGTWSDWYGVNGAGTYFTDSDGSLVPSLLNGKRWVQYSAEFISDGTSTPILSDVTVNYQ